MKGVREEGWEKCRKARKERGRKKLSIEGGRQEGRKGKALRQGRGLSLSVS